MHKPNLCPCGSTQTYEHCCEPFHKNFQAPTCEALMRSRYSAFVFGLVDYLYETTHPSHRSKSLRDEIVFTCKKVAWTKLEVLSTWQGGINDSVGKVSFCASFIQEGKEKTDEKRKGKYLIDYSSDNWQKQDVDLADDYLDHLYEKYPNDIWE